MRRSGALVLLALVFAAAPVKIAGDGTLTLEGLNQPNTLQWSSDGRYTLTTEDSRLTAARIRSTGKTLHAEGAVQAAYGSMNVSSDALDYDLDTKNLKLSGTCTFQNESFQGSAQQMAYSVATQDISLKGDAHLSGEGVEATAPAISLAGGRTFELPEGGKVVQERQEVTARSIKGTLADRDFYGTLEGPLTFKLDMGGQSIEIRADSGEKPLGSTLLLLQSPKVALSGGTLNAERAELDRASSTGHFTGHVTGDYQQRKFSSDKAKLVLANGHFTVTLTGAAQISLPSESIVKKH